MFHISVCKPCHVGGTEIKKSFKNAFTRPMRLVQASGQRPNNRSSKFVLLGGYLPVFLIDVLLLSFHFNSTGKRFRKT